MKYATIGIVVLIILGAAGFFLYSQNSSDTMMKDDEVMMQKESDAMESSEVMMEESMTEGSAGAMDKDGDSMMMSHGGYAPYSQSAFENASGDKRVLFFYANWCPICKPVDAELSAEGAKIPAGVEIFRVNYNDTDTDAADKALAQKYGITYQHTFVQVDEQGNEVAKWNGGGLDKIIASLK